MLALNHITIFLNLVKALNNANQIAQEINTKFIDGNLANQSQIIS